LSDCIDCAWQACPPTSSDCKVPGICQTADGTVCTGETNIEDGTSCHDGDVATTFDICTAGACAGTPVTCDGGLIDMPANAELANTGTARLTSAQPYNSTLVFACSTTTGFTGTVTYTCTQDGSFATDDLCMAVEVTPSGCCEGVSLSAVTEYVVPKLMEEINNGTNNRTATETVAIMGIVQNIGRRFGESAEVGEVATFESAAFSIEAQKVPGEKLEIPNGTVVADGAVTIPPGIFGNLNATPKEVILTVSAHHGPSHCFAI
jgi:hypothetical protein